MARVLHTSDWHIGKGIRGNSRAEEHRAVLAEIAQIAGDEQVDLVVVAGDIFDTAAPKPDSEAIAYQALIDLAETGAEVAVVAGNHDNALRLRAVEPLLRLARVHVVHEPLQPGGGGARRLALRSGEDLDVAFLPFVSQRGIVRADELMRGVAHEHAQAYAERMAALLGLLCGSFDASVPSLLVAHAFVLGAEAGGGERAAHLVEEYAVAGPSFPATVGYVALGHLHRAQKVPGATQIHYCGSPLQLDFGETSDPKQVNIVELRAGAPAKVTPHPLSSGTPLHTLTGTVSQIVDAAGALPDDAWLRARIDEPRRAGIAEELRAALADRSEQLVDVLLVGSADDRVGARAGRAVEGRTPRELFTDYLTERSIEDPRLLPLFDQLHDDAVRADHAEDVA